ncbi:MAG: TlpA disulfide reductase family protein [Methylovulum sp.]|uniref:TlpA family protein disulfide reductase n=1 Tax=Methylovulum sp. TaxID=1916980 RepID=UPI00260430B1|nr:TlpA disulfide reductase family protein [Methylovulum sp.]MDD2723025.1 TlpA disulfide reductase family protein [Methylovulum sp.]MDD5124767.1 TlpA disulfide reductase family protein [Methylovulum sp.]
MNRRSLSLLFLALVVSFIPMAHAVEPGDTAPDCQLKSFPDAEPQSLKQFQGKVLYIDFWASWCGPCAKSFPFLDSLNSGLKGRGLQVIGVNMDENAEDAQNFLAKYPVGFTIVADANGQCAEKFAVQAMPSSYLIDQKGVVRHVHLGFKSGEAEELKSLVDKLLAGP